MLLFTWCYCNFHFNADTQSNAHATEFLGTTDSFNFVQHVTCPTHNCGHTLDLVLTLGLTIASLELEDLGVPNPQRIRFFIPFDTMTNSKLPVHYFRSLNNSTVIKFSDAYKVSSMFTSTNTHFPQSDTVWRNLWRHSGLFCTSESKKHSAMVEYS